MMQHHRHSFISLRYSLRSLRLCGSFLLRGSFLLLALAGCGDGRSETAPVTGEVVYQGAPVEGAEVTFTPDGGALATGITDAAGKFTLRTFADGDGAVPGTHRATVVKSVAAPTTPDDPYPMAKNMLPARYGQLDQSGFQFDVRSGESHHFRLELAD